LYKLAPEFVTPMKLVGLIKMCLNKTYSKVYNGKYLYDEFSVQIGLKQNVSLSFSFNFAFAYAIR
jgi:hypothetical protein